MVQSMRKPPVGRCHNSTLLKPKRDRNRKCSLALKSSPCCAEDRMSDIGGRRVACHLTLPNERMRRFAMQTIEGRQRRL